MTSPEHATPPQHRSDGPTSDGASAIAARYARLRRRYRRLVLVRRVTIAEHHKFWGNVAASVVTGVVFAILGSVVAARFAQEYQERLSRANLYAQARQEALQQQYAMLKEFGEQFPRSLHVAYQMRLGWCWLREHPATDPAAVHAATGLARADFRSHYDRVLIADYWAEPNVAGLCSRVGAMFDDPATIASAHALRDSCFALLDAEDAAAVRELHDRANGQFQDVIVKIGDELRSGGRRLRGDE